MSVRTAFYSMLLFLVSCSVAFAQTITASVTGTVTDPSGAAVGGAEVTALNTDTGVDM